MEYHFIRWYYIILASIDRNLKVLILPSLKFVSSIQTPDTNFREKKLKQLKHYITFILLQPIMMEMLLLLLFMVSASMSMDPPYIRWKLLGPHIYKPWTLPIQDWGTTLVNLNNWVLVWTWKVSKPPLSLLTCRRTLWSQQEELTCSFL